MLPPIHNRHRETMNISAAQNFATSNKERRRQWADQTAKLVIKDPIIHSIRKSNYYIEDEKIAIVVICNKYDQLRTRENCSKYLDLEEVIVDRDVVLERLTRLSFTEDEILLMEDPSYNDINIYVRELALRVAKATAADKKLLIFWYFAGHGTQDNTVSMMLN